MDALRALKTPPGLLEGEAPEIQIRILENGFPGDSRSHEGPRVVLRDPKSVLKDRDTSMSSSKRPQGGD